jgi:2-polyprenyl-6-hydroxyphenyl methylase/3-demethylubiquinone-9 3-methyltransferase
MDRDYYVQKLSALRLERVYAIANPRVKRYLQAEIDHVAAYVKPGDHVLELGCGYGRVLEPLVSVAGRGCGVDNAYASLRFYRQKHPARHLAAMDAAALAFKAHTFDLVLGIQNFISACKVPPRQLLRECLRVARPGGWVLLSSYAAEFWPHRLAWFRRQAREGLLGPIDEKATGNGVIVCRDGFTATTFTPLAFDELARSCAVQAQVDVVDNSSVFCAISVPDRPIPAR